MSYHLQLLLCPGKHYTGRFEQYRAKYRHEKKQLTKFHFVPGAHAHFPPPPSFSSPLTYLHFQQKFCGYYYY